jgi:hypothetical protein
VKREKSWQNAKCKKEVTKPKKTWKMAGRKDKNGKKPNLQ